jgi:hypothetical protein
MKKSSDWNSMSPEDFEKQLQERPIRRVPAEWRAEILATAKAAASSVSPVNPAKKKSPLSTIGSYISGIFSLQPGALAGLAAVWVLIFVFHISTHDESQVAVDSTPVSKEVMAEAREQRQFYAEMVGLCETRDAEPPRTFLPRPRSEGRCQTVMV